MNEVVDAIRAWIQEHIALGTVLALAVFTGVAYVADILAKQVLVRSIRRVTRRTRFTWDDELIRHRVFDRLALLVPAAVFYFGFELLPGFPDTVVTAVERGAVAAMLVIGLLAVGAALNAGNAMYEQLEIARTRPIKGYLQVGKIIIYVVGALLVLATLMDQSPLLFLSGIGAMTAVLLLVFKDTILSLVASVQLTSNDMIRLGDWIEVPGYGADGDVIDIALHTVKVQNWDKTITTVPTYALISGAFKNWRSMPESGGRRIKRSIFIDQSSVRFLTDEEIARFKRFVLLRDYLESKEQELREYNERLKERVDDDVNLRRLTNLGTFRAYVLNYVRNHPRINQELTVLVRQLAPTSEGLPIELYIFTSDTDWIAYESIQADIFDHLISILPEFGLRVFQNPTGSDVLALTEAVNR